jgi:hypothetical protein
MLEELFKLLKASWDMKSLFIEVIYLSPCSRVYPLRFKFGLASSGLHRPGLSLLAAKSCCLLDTQIFPNGGLVILVTTEEHLVSPCLTAPASL